MAKLAKSNLDVSDDIFLHSVIQLEMIVFFYNKKGKIFFDSKHFVYDVIRTLERGTC